MTCLAAKPPAEQTTDGEHHLSEVKWWRRRELSCLAAQPPTELNDCRRTPRGNAKVVEAAGVERELAGFSKYLMALGFWANLRCFNSLSTTAVSAAVPSDPPISTVVLER